MTSLGKALSALFLVTALTIPQACAELSSSNLPAELQKVGIDQKTNSKMTLDATFTDEGGKSVRLADYFGKKPVVLAPVYYGCPMLCQQILSGLASSLKGMSFVPGQDFEVVAISFDSTETPTQAAAAKKAFLEKYGRPEGAAGLHFLTGNAESVKTFTGDLGFRYEYDEVHKQFAHASMIAVAEPDGRIFKYFYGIDYAPKEVKFALMDAAQGKMGTFIDQILLFCYHYDYTSSKYGRVIMNTMRLAGLATVIAMFMFIFGSLRKERKHA